MQFRHQPRHRGLALLAGLTLAGAVQAQLVVNGSFESPGGCEGGCVLPGGSTAIPGWITLLSGVEYINPLVLGVGPVPDGLMAVDLANFTYPEGGGIQQTLPTVTGQTYTLSFSLGNSRFDGRDGTGTVRVQVAGLDLLFNTPVATTVTGVWATASVDFVALAASTTLRFLNEQDPLLHYAVIDQVSVVPELPVWAMSLAGLVGVIGWASRRLGAATADSAGRRPAI